MDTRGRFRVAVGCVLLCAVGTAKAQSSPSAERRSLYRVLGDDPEQRASAERLLLAYGAANELTLHHVAEPQPAVLAHEVPEAALSVLTRVERALLEARELSTQFHEAAALRVLAGVERELLEALELPGAQAFLAEIYVQIGLCAALLGEDGLAETSLTRALSLDPTRRVEAAEAPPRTLALARRIARNHDVLPASDSALQVQPPNATVWLDGAQVEGGSLHARAGLHLLVVSAPGHRPYASLLTLEPGRRPMLGVVLSASAEHEARLALLRATSDLRASALRLAATTQEPVYLVEGGLMQRALVQRCAAGCQLFGLEGAQAQQRHFHDERAARAWLAATALPAPPLRERPVWKRWPVWAGGAALVAAGMATLFVLREDPATKRQRQLEIDPGVPPP